MLVNQNPCFVDIRRRPGYYGYEIYLAMQSGIGRIAIAQPVKLEFIEQDECAAIGKPTIELYDSPNIENWFKATLTAIFEACPHLFHLLYICMF